MVADDNTYIWNRSTSTITSRSFNSPVEGDMRDEMLKFLYGSSREIPKAQRGLYRKVRLDSNGDKIVCDCVDSVTREPDKNPPCPLCLGVGYLWDEVWFDYYKIVTGIEAALSLREEFIQPGIANIPRITFYTKYDVAPVIINGYCNDQIIELARDVEGNLVTPYRRERIYRISSAIDFRSDNGRLEYWKFNVISDDIPGEGMASST